MERIVEFLRRNRLISQKTYMNYLYKEMIRTVAKISKREAKYEKRMVKIRKKYGLKPKA